MLLYIEEKVNAMQPWYKRIMNLFATGTDETGTSAPETPPPAQPGMPVKELVEAALNTLPDEISCDECFQEVDRFVELQLAGLDAAEATTAAIVSWLAAEHPGVEVEVHEGGQPLYPYFLGVE